MNSLASQLQNWGPYATVVATLFFALGAFLFAWCSTRLIRVCNDGWLSKSIGKRGACSWHGGVANAPVRANRYRLMWIALGAAVGTAFGSVTNNMGFALAAGLAVALLFVVGLRPEAEQ